MISNILPKICDSRKDDIVLYKMYDTYHNQWLGSGLKRGGHGKVWNTIGHIKSAINSALYNTINRGEKDAVNACIQHIVIYKYTFSKKDTSMMNIKYDGNKFEVFNESKTSE